MYWVTWVTSCYFCQTLQAGGRLIYAVIHGPDIHGRLSQCKLLCYSCKQKAKHVFHFLPFFIYTATISNEGESNKHFRFDSLSYYVRGTIDPPLLKWNQSNKKQNKNNNIQNDHHLLYPELNSSSWLTCSEAGLFDFVRHLGVELFILLQIRPHAPQGASFAPGTAPTSCRVTSAPTLPLNQVSHSPLGHCRWLGDMFLYCGHQTWIQQHEIKILIDR